MIHLMTNHTDNIKKIIKRLNIDALFITNQQNVSYLTGFTGLASDEREGFFLITRNHAYFFVFPTYLGLFEKGGNGFTVLCLTHDKRLTDHLKEIVKKEKIRSIGIEEKSVTLFEFAELITKVKTKWRKTKGIVEGLRIIKDETELGYIRKAAKITDNAFDFIKGKIKKDISEKNLALELEFFLKKKCR